MPQTLALALALMLLTVSASAATTYYVSADGDDANDGASPDRPWRTLAKANGAELAPGDQVLLRRGDAWREQLRPHSGEEGAPVLYGAYGEGPKPLLLGSVDASDPSYWREQNPGIWVSARPEPVPAAASVLPNGGFERGEETWSLYCENGARASHRLSADAAQEGATGLRVECAASGEARSDIQLYTLPIAVEAGVLYQLEFRARCSTPMDVASPSLMSAGPPWSGYAEGPGARVHRATEEWGSFTQYYRCSTTADDGRLTFFLGGALSAGATLELDGLSLRACSVEGEPLMVDVGNIILGDEEGAAVKVFEEVELTEPGRFWYDEDANVVKMRCDANPAEQYGRLELALRRHIIDEGGRSHVIYENLDLRYGGAHGVGGGGVRGIIVRDSDLSWIGGGDQMGGDRTVRFGNGIEFWGGAEDCLVERCRLWEIYDAALTNQSAGADVAQRNIAYRNNLIWNSEYSFEYWNRPETAVTENIVFEHNTCLDAGYGWGHTQRPDPSGRHLCFYDSTAPATGLVVRNNIFDGAAANALYAPTWSVEQLGACAIDGNCWWQPDGAIVWAGGEYYTMAEFDRYRARFGLEANSLLAEPLLRDPAGRDFRLRAGSPCIDAGVESGVEKDFDGTSVPHGPRPDIGAHEWRR